MCIESVPKIGCKEISYILLPDTLSMTGGRDGEELLSFLISHQHDDLFFLAKEVASFRGRYRGGGGYKVPPPQAEGT